MPSRHDHFPRADAARRVAMRRAVADLDAAWRAADTAPDGLLTVIAALAHAPADVVIAGLLPWLSNTHWLRDRLDAALALLAADPFTRPPLRMVGGGDDGPGGLVLADHGAVRLTLQLRPFSANEAAPGTAVFVPGGAAIHVLDGGGAELRAHSVAVSAAEEAGGFTAQGAARCHSQPPRPLRTGETLILDTARQSFTLQHGRAGARSDILYLELTVQPPSRLPIRAYAIASGRLTHVSASRRDSSFRQMALALLRQLGRTDAAPLFVAETASEDFAARWNAMRELVALDPAAALPHLGAMAARDPHPEVRAAAAATHALFSLPSGETGREGGGGPGSCTSPAPSTPKPAPRAKGPAPCPA
ncbi:HEAT repeat domain-containing protein [Sphingopyxis sp.]|uniref:HEAT repeat domain-containing protein n=1 Tax=Sphingopyxis sp. TaxID=1908224 RepID=UPI0025EE7BA1|nr:HEAT repeat domain-containing protein [Sphingopyxis sp.]MBR2172699.1 HEAT repeat domain-containing protein [Sphingopyxis sp.]